jgi:IS30 family transposase
MREVAAFLGRHYATISRVLERALRWNADKRVGMAEMS